MDNSKDQEIIDRFLRKELSGEDLQEFNQRISEDDSFAKEVAEQMAIRETLRKIRREEISQIIDQQAPPPKPVWKKALPYVVAAVLIGIILVVIFPPFRKPQLTKEEREQVIAGWQAKEEPALRVAGTTWRNLILDNDFDGALNILDSLIIELNDPCDDPELAYFAGVLHLYHRQNFRIAEEYLTCALGETAGASFRPWVPRHLVTVKAVMGKGKQAKASLRQYDVQTDSLPETIQQYLQLDVQG